MKIKVIIFLHILFWGFISPQLPARGTYQEPQAFLEDVFDGSVPVVSKLWIQNETKQQVRSILGHDLGVLRVSYWREGERTAWILEEIGKSLPITVGIVINANKIEKVKILIFRESRGWEVRYPFYTDQFLNVKLKDKNELDKGIDGISGATLSVRAVNRLAVLSLYFHQLVTQ